MKYLAILKDAIYETIDFKIFYILMGVSVLLALCGFIFSFPREPVDKVLQERLGSTFTVSDVEVVAEPPFSSQGTYRFVLTRKNPGPLPRALTKTTKEQLEERRGPGAFMRQLQDGTFGISDGKILAATPGSDNPDRVQGEVTLNWSELPNSHRFVVFFGAVNVPLELQLGMISFSTQATIVDFVGGWVGLIIAVIVSAGFVPNMLRKGTVDLLLVKPISRPALIVYKYLGGLSFVFFNAAVLVFTSWVVLGLIMRVWSVYYLASILVLTAYFAVLYSFSVFIGVLTRSQLACILVTMTFWLLIFAVNAFYNIAHNPQSQLQLSDNVVAVVDAIHYVLPRMNDLSQLNQFKLAEGNGLDELLQSELKSAVEQFSWVESLVTSGAFIVLMLGLSSWWFSRADY